MTREWLVVAYKNTSMCVYSLPELRYKDQVDFGSDIWLPRADRAGLVYLPGPPGRLISVLTISDTGNLTLLRKLTLGGTTREIFSVATGPQLGELCVGISRPPRVVILNVADDNITHNLSLPDGTDVVTAVGVLHTGQILIQVHIGHGVGIYIYVLAFYSSYAAPPVLLNDLKPLSGNPGMIGHVNHFLFSLGYDSLILIVDADGQLVSTVDALNGNGVVWLDMMLDVAIWDNCVWVLSLYGALILLCPV